MGLDGAAMVRFPPRVTVNMFPSAALTAMLAPSVRAKMTGVREPVNTGSAPAPPLTSGFPAPPSAATGCTGPVLLVPPASTA